MVNSITRSYLYYKVHYQSVTNISFYYHLLINILHCHFDNGHWNVSPYI